MRPRARPSTSRFMRSRRNEKAGPHRKGPAAPDRGGLRVAKPGDVRAPGLVSIVADCSMVPQLAYTMLMPVGLSRLFDAGILAHDERVILVTLAWLTGGYVLSATAGLTQDCTASIAATRAVMALREQMFRHAQRLADDVLQEIESSDLTATSPAISRLSKPSSRVCCPI